jgi:type II secretory pathway component GspD/PulD (secretin)
MSIRRVALSTLVAVALLAAPAAADEPTATSETAEISLQQLDAANALTLLRTIADTRRPKMVDERTVGVTDSPEVVALAKSVVDLAEHPSDAAGEIATHAAADGSVIAAVRLQHASMADVAGMLRTEVKIHKAAYNQALSTVVVRDTPEQVQAAIELIRRLDSPRQ